MATPDPSSCYLNVDKHFNKVSLACKSISHSWEDLAKYLDIDKNTVLSIQAEVGQNTGKCLDKLLVVWLRRPTLNQHEPSWRILRDAVSNIDGPLSEKIWTDHTSGCSLCKEKKGNVRWEASCPESVTILQQNTSTDTTDSHDKKEKEKADANSGIEEKARSPDQSSQGNSEESRCHQPSAIEPSEITPLIRENSDQSSQLEIPENTDPPSRNTLRSCQDLVRRHRNCLIISSIIVVILLVLVVAAILLYLIMNHKH